MAPFRSKVGMNRSALPLVLGVWGRACGAGRLGPGEDVADGQEPQRRGAAAGAVGAAVVGHAPLGADALGAAPAQGAQQEGCRGVAALVGRPRDMGQPRRVIDRDLHAVPAREGLRQPALVPVTRWPGWSKPPSVLLSSWISRRGARW